MPQPATTTGSQLRLPSDVQLVMDGDHFERVVVSGILKSRVSLDIRTADFKAMLVPTAGSRRAKSIVEIFCDLAKQVYSASDEPLQPPL